jgi:hypothetical protein
MKKSILLLSLFIYSAILSAQTATFSITSIKTVGNKVTFTVNLNPSGVIYLGNFDIDLNFVTSNPISSAGVVSYPPAMPVGNTDPMLGPTSINLYPDIVTSGVSTGRKINFTPGAPTNPFTLSIQVARLTSSVTLGTYFVNFTNPFDATTTGLSLTCGGVTTTRLFAFDPATFNQVAIGSPSLPISCSGSSSLPLELLAFTAATNAKSNKTTAQLSWLTAREVNLQGYEVERSGDGKTYEKIGSVKPTGSASSTEKYAFTDDVPLSGTNYYRLKMVNTEGSFTYSAVRSVLVSDGKTDKVSVSPNPAKDRVVVKLNALEAKNVTLTLVDVAGKTVLTDNKSLETGFNEFSLNVAKLPQGLYFLKVADGKTSEMHRLVIGN